MTNDGVAWLWRNSLWDYAGYVHCDMWSAYRQLRQDSAGWLLGSRQTKVL